MQQQQQQSSGFFTMSPIRQVGGWVVAIIFAVFGEVIAGYIESNLPDNLLNYAGEIIAAAIYYVPALIIAAIITLFGLKGSFLSRLLSFVTIMIVLGVFILFTFVTLSKNTEISALQEQQVLDSEKIRVLTCNKLELQAKLGMLGGDPGVADEVLADVGSTEITGSDEITGGDEILGGDEIVDAGAGVGGESVAEQLNCTYPEANQ